MKLNLGIVKVKKPENVNIIIGQAHFIKTVEDIYEVLFSSMPSIKFGLAFCEASGKCLVRSAGSDKTLERLAADNALSIGSGHMFIVILQDAYPINILNQIKNVPEVCRIFCATANPVEVIVVTSEQGKGILGVIDGASPLEIEGEEDIKWRKDLLRKIGYKL